MSLKKILSSAFIVVALSMFAGGCGNKDAGKGGSSNDVIPKPTIQ